MFFHIHIYLFLGLIIYGTYYIQNRNSTVHQPEMASKILLVLGGGRNIGLSVAKRFHQNGYKVAVVSRTSSSDYDGTADLVIKEDLATGESGIQSIFKQVREKLGEPGVVVYNGK